MGHHTENDKLREDRIDQEKRRQEIRDGADETNGGTDDVGSQDKRRKEGRNAPDVKELREDKG